MDEALLKGGRVFYVFYDHLKIVTYYFGILLGYFDVCVLDLDLLFSMLLCTYIMLYSNTLAMWYMN